MRRGKAAIDEIDTLPACRGTCVHDGWLSDTDYPDCRHALCGAHLLRELTYFEEFGEVTKGCPDRLHRPLRYNQAERDLRMVKLGEISF